MPRFKPAFVAAALTIGALTLAGCASQPAVPPPQFPGIEQSDSVAVQDLQPKTESEKEMFSLLVTSSAYGIMRMPDEATKPTGVRLLAHRAWEALPQLREQPSIKVHHFVTYANMQSRLRKNSLLAGFTGPIGVLIAGDPENVPGQVQTSRIDSTLLAQTEGDEEYTRAQFSEQENPEKMPVNLIYIDTEMLGQRLASRCLVPPQADKPNMFLVEVFDLCIERHLALYGSKATDPSLSSR